MRKLLPVLLALLGLGAGVGAGFALKPAPPAVEHADHSPAPEPVSAGSREYVPMSNQFVVPLIENGRVTSLIVISLSIEATMGSKDTILAREPRLRDAFIQVMFDHANSGGFRGNFTNSSTMLTLRAAMKEAAQKTLGPIAHDVLVVDILRQDN